jgi:hypothetical protein
MMWVELGVEKWRGKGMSAAQVWGRMLNEMGGGGMGESTEGRLMGLSALGYWGVNTLMLLTKPRRERRGKNAMILMRSSNCGGLMRQL